MGEPQVRRSIDERIEFPELQPVNPDRFLDGISVTYKKRDGWEGLGHFLEEETVDISYHLKSVKTRGIGFRVINRDYSHISPSYSQQQELDSEVRDVMARSLPSDVLRVAGIEPFRAEKE